MGSCTGWKLLNVGGTAHCSPNIGSTVQKPLEEPQQHENQQKLLALLVGIEIQL